MPALRLLAPALLLTGMLGAQTTLITARVASDPPGAAISVDGVTYNQAAVFFWRPGSTHALSLESGQNFDVNGARYSFVNWTDSTGHDYGASTTITVSANPSVYSYKAVFAVQYSVDLQYFACASNWSPAACPGSPGTVYINGTGFYKNGRVWLPAGDVVPVSAVANSGWVFAGWENAFARPAEPAQTFTLDAPVVLQPQFVYAGNVTIASDPAGLKVSVDSAIVYAPQSFQWGVGTSHALRPVSPQEDAAGRYWFFRDWSNGGAAEQTYTVPPVVDRHTLTAAYVRGAVVTVLAEPAGPRVKVDGSDLWPGSNFIWAVGSVHRLEAPEDAADGAGRRYRFLGWSDGVAGASRDLTVSAGAVEEGQRLVARYELLGRLTVESTPSGIAMTVAGAACLTPCTIDRAAGTAVAIAAPAASPLTEESRLEFDSWQDQAARERSYTFTVEERRITVSYRTLYRVRVGADPEGGALVTLEPPSADRFYVSGTQLQAAAVAAPGYRFRRWAGDLDGTSQSGALLVGGPRSVIARMDEVPWVPPAGVVNAAGITPVEGVAAGSILAIYGLHLAPAVVVGPASPLAQSLGGVTVQAGDRLLPLYFVSPGQINALMPSGFVPGNYILTVRSSGQPDVTAAVRVVRNAPGLFASVVDSVAYAVAVHEDGTSVSPASPVRSGEAVTLLGTGFGPYLPAPLDGFAVPEGVVFGLADPVEVVLGTAALLPTRSGAAAGFAGVEAVAFRIPQQAAGPLPLKVRVNGIDSNTVTLAVSQGP